MVGNGRRCGGAVSVYANIVPVLPKGEARFFCTNFRQTPVPNPGAVYVLKLSSTDASFVGLLPF